jgi:hypothetical protein
MENFLRIKILEKNLQNLHSEVLHVAGLAVPLAGRRQN